MVFFAGGAAAKDEHENAVINNAQDKVLINMTNPDFRIQAMQRMNQDIGVNRSADQAR